MQGARDFHHREASCQLQQGCPRESTAPSPVDNSIIQGHCTHRFMFSRHSDCYIFLGPPNNASTLPYMKFVHALACSGVVCLVINGRLTEHYEVHPLFSLGPFLTSTLDFSTSSVRGKGPLSITMYTKDETHRQLIPVPLLGVPYATRVSCVDLGARPSVQHRHCGAPFAAQVGNGANPVTALQHLKSDQAIPPMWVALSTHLVVRVGPPGDGLWRPSWGHAASFEHLTPVPTHGLPPNGRYEAVTGRDRSGSINPATAINA